MSEKSKMIEIIKNAGLTKNESLVYHSMLALGPSSIQNIAKHAKIQRTAVYPILKTLEQKGLIRKEDVRFKQRFVPEHPKNLERLLESKLDNVHEIIPQLEAMHALEGEEAYVKYYEGLEGAHAAYNDLLDNLYANDEYLVFGDPDKWTSTNQSFYKQFIKKRLRIDLDVKILLVDSPTAREYKKTEKNFQEEVRLLPKNATIDANTVITPRQLLLQQMQPPHTVMVIENKFVIKLQQQLFNIIWSNTKQ